MFPSQTVHPRLGERVLCLTKGLVTLIDAVDYDLVSSHSWQAHEARSKVYASRMAGGRGGRSRQYLQRVITGAKPGWVVDHLNGDSLDNRRNNLRVCGFDKNAQNCSYDRRMNGFRGVSKHGRRFRARIQYQGVTKHLGGYASALEAAEAYDRAALEMFGPFAWTNFPRDLTAAETLASRACEDIPF